jgi:acyl transferase domain-containing protein/acyl carrier protein
MTGENSGESIAIIGISCRFPGARDYREFWRNLIGGVDSVRTMTDDELRAAGVSERKLADPHYVKAAATVEDVAGFDARLFRMTPREAEILDPQYRMFLEGTYAAMEDAGYDITAYPGSVGVYAGAASSGYAEHFVKANARVRRDTSGMQISVSTGPDYLASLVSYRFGLNGPSISLHTACSTSLVAVHLAAQALAAGECDAAIAGGADVELPDGHGYEWIEGSIYSRGGRCRPFDAAADGTIFGTGCGVVVLKRLADAQRDGDPVHAVILGSAINNDGSSRAGFSAPGVAGQTMLIAEAIAAADVPASSITYVEAHATGTLVGDPIEVSALTKAFAAHEVHEPASRVLGAVKGNIGHMGPASGVAGLIKVCLAMRHGVIPPTINYSEPNPRLSLAETPFHVNTEPLEWHPDGIPRRAGVSSFGIGGTNAHVIVQEPPRRRSSTPSARENHLLPVSTQGEANVDRAVRRLAEDLGDRPDEDLADVAYTLQTGRAAHDVRRAVVATTVADAVAALSDPDTMVTGDGAARPRSVVFMFPGQGAQHRLMGAGLHTSEPVYREAVDRCATVLEPVIGLDLRALLLSDDPDTDDRLRRTEIAQPALFTVEYAVACLLQDWDVSPAAMIGHSVGEYVAACLAGVFTLDEALLLVAERGRLMARCEPGSMLAVPVSETHLAPMLPVDVEVAAVNTSGQVVVSGPTDSIEMFAEQMSGQGVRTSLLRTSHAFHSAAVDPVLDLFRRRVAEVRLSGPRIPVLSNVTGTWLTTEQATSPDYWADQMRGAVRFADGVTTAAQLTDPLFLQVGPGWELTGMAKRCVAGQGVPVLATMRRADSDTSDETALTKALARLWVAGVDPDWSTYWADESRHRLTLPEYPFQRTRYWVEPDQPSAVEPTHREDETVEPLPVSEALFAPVWEQQSLPVRRPAIDPGSTWLVFSSGHDCLTEFTAGLRAAGAVVTVVTAGTHFERLDEDTFTVQPGDRADIARLFDDLGPVPAHVVHGFACTDAVPDPLADESVRDTTEAGFHSLLQLAQELAARVRGQDERIQVYAVTSNAQDVTGEEDLEPAKALVLGPSLLIGRELRGISCRAIDLALPSRLAAGELAGQLLAEVTAPDAGTRTAWRHRKRWAWSYETVTTEQPAGRPAMLRDRGVYLITGGLGALGLTVAEDLAKAVAARLVLIGRSPVPPKDTWRETVNAPDTDPASRATLERLLAIEHAGGEVLVMSCDVTDESQLRAVVDETRRQFGALHGVIHSAGVAGGGMLAVKTRQMAEQVFAPKIAGALALHRVLGDQVDFVVLFSSLTSVIGEFGQVDYCAANNFLDTLARRLANAGAPVCSVGWGAWQHLGMASDLSAPVLLREWQSGGTSESADHELLDRRVHDPNGDVVFSTVIRPGGHWVIDDHLVSGTPTMPATAIVEMIRAAFTESMHATPEVRDVVFFGPIGVSSPTEIRILLHEGTDGWYDVTVAAAPVSAGPTGWVERVKARARAIDLGPAPVHDVAAIFARCPEEVVLETTSGLQSRITQTGPHWSSVRSISAGSAEEIARLRLRDDFHGECDRFVLHPGLFDNAVSHSQHNPRLFGKGNAYLPFAYGRLVARAPLPPEFLVHVRHLDTAGDEIITADITLMAVDGTELVSVEGYVFRRVDPTAITADLSGATGGAGAVDDLRKSIVDWEIPVAAGLDAMRRILHRLPGPHVVMCREGLGRNIARVDRFTGAVLERELVEFDLPVARAAARRDGGRPYEPPRTETQEALAKLWANSLGLDQVGAGDDFFELGGNSLVAVQLGARIREQFDIEFPMAALFEQPTISGLGALVDDALAAQRHQAVD